MAFFLSRYQAQKIIESKNTGKKSLQVSLDLGQTKSHVKFDFEYVILPDNQKVLMKTLSEITGNTTCYILENGRASKIQFFLNETQRFYRLLSTGLTSPPTVEVSGIRMHRTKGTDPLADTLTKISAVSPVKGVVLDTCTGLGYTAIQALKAGATEVNTIEKDEGMMRLCELNPRSTELRDDRIQKIRGDVLAVVNTFKDGYFDIIIHDPPSMSLAGKLYSLKFYQQLIRVLERDGRLFHYVGAPGSRYRGQNLIKSIMKRLIKAGFKGVKEKPQALGVVAKK